MVVATSTAHETEWMILPTKLDFEEYVNDMLGKISKTIGLLSYTKS